MSKITHTIALDDMTLEQLVQLNQGLGRQEDDIREKRQHVRKKIDALLAAQERAGIQAQIAKLQGQLDATAPGKVLTVAASAPKRTR
jgi:FtsZ-binding cell division protein ZapB